MMACLEKPGKQGDFPRYGWQLLLKEDLWNASEEGVYGKMKTCFVAKN